MNSHAILQTRLADIAKQREALKVEMSQIKNQLSRDNAFAAAREGNISGMLDWVSKRGTIKADKFIYSNLDDEGHSILDVCAIHGHANAVGELRRKYAAKASKSLFKPETYSALTEDVKNELKDIGFTPYFDAEKGAFVEFEDELRSLICFDERPIDATFNLTRLESCLQAEAPACLDLEMSYISGDGITQAFTPIEFALKHCSIEVIDLLLKYGAALQVTAMRHAFRRLDVLIYLVKMHDHAKYATATAAALDRVLTSTMETAEKRPLVSYLLELPIDWTYTIPSNRHGWNLLDLAIWYFPECVDQLHAKSRLSLDEALCRLVTKKEDRNAGDVRTRMQRMEFILSRHVDPGVRWNGKTALEWAAVKENHHLVPRLVDYISHYRRDISVENSLQAQLENISKAISFSKSTSIPHQLRFTLQNQLNLLLSHIAEVKNKLNQFDQNFQGRYFMSPPDVERAIANCKKVLDACQAKIEPSTLRFTSYDINETQRRNELQLVCEIADQYIFPDAHFKAEVKQFADQTRERGTPNYLELLEKYKQMVKGKVSAFVGSLPWNNLSEVNHLFPPTPVRESMYPMVAELAALVRTCEHRQLMVSMVELCVLEEIGDRELTVAVSPPEPLKPPVQTNLSYGGSFLLSAIPADSLPPPVFLPNSPDSSSSSSDSSSSSSSSSDSESSSSSSDSDHHRHSRHSRK